MNPSSFDHFNNDDHYRIIPAVGLSTYLSNSCSRGHLFDASTYDMRNFTLYLDEFTENALSTIRLPSSFNRDKTHAIFKRQLKRWSEEYESLLKDTKYDDSKSVSRTIGKTKNDGQTGFEKLIEYLKQDEFPPILWMEVRRASQTFVDSLQLICERMENWFRLSPKRKSESSRRSRLTQSMMKPHLPLFMNFAQSMNDFLRMMFFIEIWSCKDESLLFTKPLHWTLKDVDPVAFEAIYLELYHSISLLRQTYLENSKDKPKPIDSSKLLPWAMSQLVKTV